jgi:hypothetical protein
VSRNLRLFSIVSFSTFTVLGQDVAVEPPAALPSFSVASQPALPLPENSTLATSAPSPTLQNLLWLPLRKALAPFFDPQPVTSQPALAPVAPITTAFMAASGCSVKPLDSLEDDAATQLETDGANVVDIADMQPAAALALGRFQAKVTSIGGKIVLKSAYRPASYQKHLQDVWYKWMGELRNNNIPACQVLRSDVEAEFTRHRLLETQHPVAVSDHTRGLAFDATVDLPRNARIGRRKLTLDTLARLAGLLRPAIVADPVHFKLRGLPTLKLASRRRHIA